MSPCLKHAAALTAQVLFLLAHASLLPPSFGQLRATAGNNPTSKVWVADNGDGTYKNPVLHADYSDPDVIRVGDDFYLTASSFNAAPGLPILQSKDLVNWKLVGHVFSRQPPFEVYGRPQHGNGVWAPSIRFHNGEFHIYYSDPDYGIYLVKARSLPQSTQRISQRSQSKPTQYRPSVRLGDPYSNPLH